MLWLTTLLFGHSSSVANAVFYIENFFGEGGNFNNLYGLYGRTRVERGDFAKGARRDDLFNVEMYF